MRSVVQTDGSCLPMYSQSSNNIKNPDSQAPAPALVNHIPTSSLPRVAWALLPPVTRPRAIATAFDIIATGSYESQQQPVHTGPFTNLITQPQRVSAYAPTTPAITNVYLLPAQPGFEIPAASRLVTYSRHSRLWSAGEHRPSGVDVSKHGWESIRCCLHSVTGK